MNSSDVPEAAGAGVAARPDVPRVEPARRRISAPFERVRGLLRFRVDLLPTQRLREAVERATAGLKIPDLAATLERLKPALMRAAPIVLLFLVIRGAAWVGTKQREAWLRGQKWPPETLGVLLFGVRPRRH